MIESVNLTKKYNNKTALNNVSFQIEKGKVMGLLGPNGSGKSTLMNILAGTLNQSDGKATAFGSEIGKKTKSIVSYLPENNHLYPWMKVKDAIDFYKLNFDDFDNDKFKSISCRFQFEDSKYAARLSKGDLQKLRLALAISRRAKVFLLDEPLGGVDTLSREEVLNMIFDSISDEVIIIIATHLINEIERLFDQVLFIKNGEKILLDDCDALRRARNTSVKNVYLEIMKND